MDIGKSIERTIRSIGKMPLKYKLLAGLIVALMVWQVGASYQSGFTIYNAIETDMTLYDDSGDAAPFDGIPNELISDMNRVWTTLYATLTPSHTDGLAGFRLYLLTDDKAQTLKSQDMIASGGNYVTHMDVVGVATGNYWVRAKGFSSTHLYTYEIENPNYGVYLQYERENDLATLEDMVKAGAYGGVWPIPETVTVSEMKDDVDIYNPPDQRIYIENPWQDMEVTFAVNQASPDGPVTFTYTLITGSVSEVVMAIYDSTNARIVDTNDPNTFVFNENGGQADDTYSAKLFVTGTSGWNGVQMERGFAVDNPDPITGVTTVYVVVGGDWQLVLDGGTLSGDVLVRVEILSGFPVDCTAYLTGPLGVSAHTMTDDGTYWSVIIDTRLFVNGLYSLDVEATRAEDGATAYLSAFDVDVQGVLPDDIILILTLALAGVVMVWMWRAGHFRRLRDMIPA